MARDIGRHASRLLAMIAFLLIRLLLTQSDDVILVQHSGNPSCIKD